MKTGDMLNLCVFFNESQPIYAYKSYAYKKESMFKISRITFYLF